MGHCRAYCVRIRCTAYVHPEPIKSRMILKNINLGLTADQIRKLDKLARKLDMNRTDAIRYCIMRTAELEGIK